MKKVFALFLVVCLSIASVSFADTGDLSAMSVEELIALQAEIAGELLKRGAEKQATVPIGQYVIGKDIPAGTYTIYPAKSGFSIKVFPNENKTGEYDYIYYEYIRSEEYIGKIELLEGQVLLLDGNTIFKIYSGINFF